ncbi:hypothetical protein [Pseudoalteromonas obscura]|uniref:N-acetyltransferase domain-containing protein n=1 Tax=Pseudoalteromonas obscura TaxID=3048491 RepID=A0ABT7EGY5_9GAMM|nr:hypothetical protein [Pseudoalteromonas sp. P94(2023)]MDK2594305.1 hypothetical protein [Pseudoalteromonas sp. P94(2023)]
MSHNQTLINTFISKAVHFDIKEFTLSNIGGSKALANYLHAAYCEQDAVVNLGLVCPHCKGNNFSVSTDTYHNLTHCPICNSELVSFWSPSRTEYYFTSKINSLGYLAFHNGQLVGLIWGFPKSFKNSTKLELYADLLVIDKSLHKSKTGMGLICRLKQHFENSARAHGYSHWLGRTQVTNAPLISTFKLFGGKIVGPDPGDPATRTLWSFPLF